MKRSILLTGTFKNEGNKVVYDVAIYAQQINRTLQCIAHRTFELNSYDTLWQEVKPIVSKYFNDELFQDGGYTIFHEWLSRTK